MRLWLRSMTIIILIIYAPDEALVEEYDNNNTNNLCT